MLSNLEKLDEQNFQELRNRTKPKGDFNLTHSTIGSHSYRRHSLLLNGLNKFIITNLSRVERVASLRRKGDVNYVSRNLQLNQSSALLGTFCIGPDTIQFSK